MDLEAGGVSYGLMGSLKVSNTSSILDVCSRMVSRADLSSWPSLATPYGLAAPMP